MSRAFKLSSTKLSEFLKSTYKNSPPGYSNFDDPLETLHGGLGGQILTGSTAFSLDEPQNVWVGSAGPFYRHSCSERVLISDAAGVDAPELKLRQGGRIWYFHKNDPDPFPSRPHGHDAEDGCKLSLRDGIIYDPRTKRQKGREPLKTLRELRSRILQKWPDVTLPTLAGAVAINE
jgi:hypothetical protein